MVDGIPVLRFTQPPRALQTIVMERRADNDFPVSECVEEGSAPAGPCSSTPILRERAQPPHVIFLFMKVFLVHIKAEKLFSFVRIYFYVSYKHA